MLEAIVGVFGVVVGAWLGSYLQSRREDVASREAEVAIVRHLNRELGKAFEKLGACVEDQRWWKTDINTKRWESSEANLHSILKTPTADHVEKCYQAILECNELARRYWRRSKDAQEPNNVEGVAVLVSQTIDALDGHLEFDRRLRASRRALIRNCSAIFVVLLSVLAAWLYLDRVPDDSSTAIERAVSIEIGHPALLVDCAAQESGWSCRAYNCDMPNREARICEGPATTLRVLDSRGSDLLAIGRPPGSGREDMPKVWRIGQPEQSRLDVLWAATFGSST